MPTEQAWIGVDLDGTLAHYDGWEGPNIIGKVLPEMKEKVLAAMAGQFDGLYGRPVVVKIFTSRASHPEPEYVASVEAWLEANGMSGLEVTCKKDIYCVEIWDDRCRQVETNTGQFVSERIGHGEAPGAM